MMKNLSLHNTGFSLIELMIVVAVLAILAGIAYPQYTAYGERARRSEGRSALLNAAALEERYYSDNNQFAALATAGINTSSENGHYTLSLTLDDANNQSFTLTGTPTGPDSKCSTLTFTNTGAKGFTGPGSLSDCWGK